MITGEITILVGKPLDMKTGISEEERRERMEDFMEWLYGKVQSSQEMTSEAYENIIQKI